MKIAVFALFAVALAGCSTNPIKEAYHQRALLLAPAPSIPDGVEAAFEQDYAQAITAARQNPTQATVMNLVDTGSSVNAMHCNSWIDRLTNAENGLVLSDHNLGVASALMTAVAGIARWNPAAVAGLGAAEVAAQGFGNNLRGAIGAPASYVVQASLRGALATCTDTLVAKAKVDGFKPSQAILGVAECAAKCSSGAASAQATAALLQAQSAVKQ